MRKFTDEMAKAATAFLARHVERGWLHANREAPLEAAAVEYGLRMGWLRRELSEAHFTPIGRAAIARRQA